MLNVAYSKDKDIKALMITDPNKPNKQLIYSKMLVSGEFKIISIDRSNDHPSVKVKDNLIVALNWLKES